MGPIEDARQENIVNVPEDSTMKSKEEFYNDEEGATDAALVIIDGKAYCAGNVSYLPPPHGQGRGTLDSPCLPLGTEPQNKPNSGTQDSEGRYLFCAPRLVSR